MAIRKVTKAVLVYQAGIANVFSVRRFNIQPYGRDAVRLCQADFHTCEAFAAGLAAAGVKVTSYHCNMTGDVAGQPWEEAIWEAPFWDKMRPVFSGVLSAAKHHTDAREL